MRATERKQRGIELGAEVEWFDDPVALATSADTDIFVELIGGAEGAAKDAVEAALRAGKPVVTANKALLADHGVALAALAEEAGVALAFEAAVAGGIPVIKALRESLIGNSSHARLRHFEWHLQLYPDADAGRRAWRSRRS